MHTPPHESDVSWQVLRRIVQDWAGNSAELAEVRPLQGGAINIALELVTKDGQKAVAKISPHRVNRAYAEEAHQLDLLRQLGLPTPKVYATKLGSLEAPFSYILLEFLEGIDLAHAKHNCSGEEFELLQSKLAEYVLKLHERRSDSYTRCVEHPEKSFETWPKFFREIYDPIWHDVEKSHVLPPKIRKQIARVHERLETLLANDDGPRLTHWDLWSTNILAASDADGNWRITGILDPNCKYAHAEAELAYMELFHTVTPTFMKAYQATHRLSPEYHRARRTIYQLYPLIDHVGLFGAEYLKPLTAMVEKTESLV